MRMRPDLQEGVFRAHNFNTQISLPCVHVFWPTVHQSAFAEAGMSDIHECLFCVHPSLLAIEQRLLGCKVSHDLVMIFSTDLTIFGTFQAPVDP